MCGHGWVEISALEMISEEEMNLQAVKMSPNRVMLMSCPPSPPFLAHRQPGGGLESVSGGWWLTWVEDGTGAALLGPGLWVQSGAAPPDLHPGVLVEDFLDLDLHFSVGAFIVR